MTKTFKFTLREKGIDPNSLDPKVVEMVEQLMFDSYSKGSDDGFFEGYDKGKSEGHKDGYDEGFFEGYDKGRSECHCDQAC